MIKIYYGLDHPQPITTHAMHFYVTRYAVYATLTV